MSGFDKTHKDTVGGRTRNFNVEAVGTYSNQCAFRQTKVL
jgi:hypothetical protein